MTVTINNIRVDYIAIPNPTIEFLQGADMDVTAIRDTLRQHEASDEGVFDEGSPDPRGFIVRSSGNEAFGPGQTNAITVTILQPFVMKFEAGAIPFTTAGGNLLGEFVNSPGAIVNINNAVGAINLSSADIEHSSFENGIWINVVGGTAGIVFPIGTPRKPVNNLVDAHTLLGVRGFINLFVIGDITVSSGTHPHVWIGQSPTRSTIILDAAANLDDAEFRDATIQGVLDSSTEIVNCSINNLSMFDGRIIRSILNGMITLGNGVDAFILDCWSGIPGQLTPTIDLGGTGQGLALRNYAGGIKLINKTGPEEVSIDLNSGQVIIDDTVTTGLVLLRGVGKWTNKDTYAGGANIVNELVEGPVVQDTHVQATLARKIAQNESITDQSGSVMTVADDDGTPFLTAPIKEDAAGTQDYRGKGVEKRGRLVPVP